MFLKINVNDDLKSVVLVLEKHLHWRIQYHKQQVLEIASLWTKEYCFNIFFLFLILPYTQNPSR